MDSLTGQLLVAGGGLFDPNFRQTVLLVGQHSEEGALGVVLNRPGAVTVEEAVPPLAPIVSAGELLYLGGPVQPESPVLVAEFEHPDFADVLVFGTIGFLTGEVDAERVRGIRRARVFAGYAGWGPGQLEREMDEHSWIVERGSAEDVFTEEPGELWRSILRRKGGDFRLLSLMPFDPSLN